ncbi:MAG: SpoIID/LytB domain-containing protein [Bacillota bacterium]
MRKRGFSLRMIALLFFLLFCCGAVFSAPIPGDESLSEALAMYYRGETDAAIEKYSEYAAFHPECAEARRNLIRLLEEEGRYDEALEHLDVLLNLKPEEERCKLAKIQDAYLGGQPEKALKLSDAASGAEELYWRGLALADLGQGEAAREALALSLEAESFNPLGWFKLGVLQLQAGLYEKARTNLRQALVQEPNLTAAYFPLARTYIAAENPERAYDLLLNAALAFPGNREIQSFLGEFSATHPDLLQKRREAAEKKRRVVNPPEVLPVAENRGQIPVIRIGLAEKVQQMYIKTGAPFELAAREGGAAKGDSRTVLLIRHSGNEAAALDESGNLLLKSRLGLVLSYRAPEAATVLFDVEYGKGAFWAGREDRIYRGALEFMPKEAGITVINIANMEEYLYSVVPSEMSSKWPQAALQAQAIAARTYAFANLGYFAARGYDLSATVVSQAYYGAGNETPAARAAVDSTRGRIQVYRDKPIAAFYTGNCGGYTTNSRDLWGFETPYLHGVPDLLLPPRSGPIPPAELADWLNGRPLTYSSNPNYSARSSYRWRLWVTRRDLENRLNMRDKLGRIRSVKVCSRGDNGLAKKVLVRGNAGEYLVQGDAIRSKLGGLRSNLLVIQPKLGADGAPEAFIFIGGGWGHGVGMCQSGAAGMAAVGFSCEDILKHYYPGTETVKRY